MPTTQIVDNEQILTPGRPAQQAIVKANPAQEYLVAGVQYGWQNYAQSLPQFIDDLSALLGADIYERMLLDSCVASCQNTIVDGVLNEGDTIAPAVPETDGAYKTALELSDAARRMIDNLDTPAETVYKDMLRALAFGNRVAEKVYTVQGNALNLTAVKVKPRDVFAFVVDAYKNIVGFVGLRPGISGYSGFAGYGYASGLGFTDLKTLAKAQGTDSLPPLLPRSKFAVLTHGMQDNDPRGNSILRPAYEAWYFKTQMWPEFLKYLTQFAGPSLIALLEDGGAVGGEYLRNSTTGQPILDSNGNPTTLSHAAQVLNALLQLRNMSAGALPGVKDLKLIQSVGNGEAFRAAFQMFDQQMSLAITGQSLSSMEGEHGATSAGAGVHQDVLTKRIFSNKRLLATHVRREWLRDWVLLNYGEAYLPLTPVVSFMAPEQKDIAAMWTALGALQTSGYLDPSQYADLDKENGLPPRSEESILLAQQQQQLGLQTAQAGLEAAKNPQPSTGANSKQGNKNAGNN